ncbi:hypothetical protein QQS21_004622 [Conoideocrella luteorostrata]|uniref:Microtubule associated protein n=1 Tax=Conoideocrella luteorostrata TaxID=1105319 RepID=A0AAJ0CU18_9HYPO|nr:hypothetical protein QQS21_004622 [Conoideocrella luteorostrata]
MSNSTTPPPSPRGFEKVFHPVGFRKGYNFILWFIFAGALLGFTLARLPYLNFDGIFCGPLGSQPENLQTAPGECYYYRGGHGRIGIMLHLATVLPAAFLVCFQFVPIIRYKLLLFHRINGHVIILLSLVSTAGAFMIMRHAFGGEPETQIYLALTGGMFLVALGLAYYNIKRLRIAQHRAWMLRAWFYAGTIISLRLIMMAAAKIISIRGGGGYYSARPCAQIDDVFGHIKEYTLFFYPACEAWYRDATETMVVVKADRGGNPMEIAVALDIFFGSSGMLALLLHGVGVELYLLLTSAEDTHLRNVSLQRRVEKGMGNAGSDESS